MKSWREYASVLEKRAKGLRSELHGDLRQQIKKQRVGRGMGLTRTMERSSEEGGGREGAALTNAPRRRRDGAVKNVFTQTGPDGRSRKVAHTEHVAEGLGQLVNATRVGRFFYGGWTQEMLYTFIKVPGAMGLENSRPVGLLEILQKASYAFDFSATTEVWEREGLLHDSQYAFRAKKRTE